jgi:hypothetical protein
MNPGDGTETDAHPRGRRSWAANITFLGVGLMIGGSTDISGPGGGMLVIGALVGLFGAVGLAFKTQ